MTVTIPEAQARFSELVERALAGERVLVSAGGENAPVVELTPVERRTESEENVRRLGPLEHLNLSLPDSFFFDPLPEEELRLWEGERE